MKTETREVSINDKSYPQKLKYINNPPMRLYYKGNISLANDSRFVAVVGARKASEYGRRMAHNISKRLAENGVTIVSGMAQGIDSAAHYGCLEAGGKTIAVLGTGIEKCFPSFNKELKQKLEESDLVISEFPGEYPGSKYSFPLRNRIISGLSDGVLVVEAGIKSGSLITAELAVEQGRMVYAVPGNATNIMSMGTNKLIQDGAMLIIKAEEILEDMGISPNREEIYTDLLSADEKKIFIYVKEHGESNMEDVGKALKFSQQKMFFLMTELEMKGMLCSSMGKIFIAK